MIEKRSFIFLIFFEPLFGSTALGTAFGSALAFDSVTTFSTNPDWHKNFHLLLSRLVIHSSDVFWFEITFFVSMP